MTYFRWPRSTIHDHIVATDAGTTPAGMVMALTYEHALGQYMTVATSPDLPRKRGPVSAALCEAAGDTAWRLPGCTGLGIGDGHPTHLPRGRTMWRRDTPSLCADLGGGAPGSNRCNQHSGHALPMDHQHQRTARCSGRRRAIGRPHLDYALPLRMLTPGKVPGPLPASPYGPTGVVAEQATIPTRVRYEHRWGPNYWPSLALPMIHQ